jgi:hypothetical protein
LILIVTLVDIAGYFFVFAIFRLITHLPFLEGATSRDALIEQGPDSDHVLFPVDTVRMNDVRRVCDFLATDVFRMMKPGLATIFFAVGLMPTVVCAATAKEYSRPLTRPPKTHPVAVVVHTVAPRELVTT